MQPDMSSCAEVFHLESILYAQQVVQELDVRFKSPEFSQRTAYFGEMRKRLLRRRTDARRADVSVGNLMQTPW
jgi:hypothetical protein